MCIFSFIVISLFIFYWIYLDRVFKPTFCVQWFVSSIQRSNALIFRSLSIELNSYLLCSSHCVFLLRWEQFLFKAPLRISLLFKFWSRDLIFYRFAVKIAGKKCFLVIVLFSNHGSCNWIKILLCKIFLGWIRGKRRNQPTQTRKRKEKQREYNTFIWIC